MRVAVLWCDSLHATDGRQYGAKVSHFVLKTSHQNSPAGNNKQGQGSPAEVREQDMGRVDRRRPLLDFVKLVAVGGSLYPEHLDHHMLRRVLQALAAQVGTDRL